MFAQHCAKRCDVARDDRLHSSFESAYRSILTDRPSKRDQLLPILKAMFLSDDNLCVGQVQRRGSHSSHGLASKAWVHPFKAPLGPFVARIHGLEQHVRLFLMLLERGVE